jgi:DNA-binding transcriptional regulator YiaG
VSNDSADSTAQDVWAEIQAERPAAQEDSLVVPTEGQRWLGMRLALGLTQSEVGTLFRVSRSTIASWERDEKPGDWRTREYRRGLWRMAMRNRSQS